MKQINHGFRPEYYLDQDGTVYNSISGKYIKSTNHKFRLRQIDNTVKSISLRSLYMLVYGKLFVIDEIQDLDGEIWKEIANTEGCYYISNKARVKSCKGYKSKLLKPYTSNSSKYQRIDLFINGTRQSVLVHKLVALYFLPIVFPQDISTVQVHHINGNIQDNCVQNLIWVNKYKHRKFHKEKSTKIN